MFLSRRAFIGSLRARSPSVPTFTPFHSTQLTRASRGYAIASDAQFIVPSNNLIREQTEYRQLPDDSQYIEKFYNELIAFNKEIVENTKIPYRSFSEFESDPNALIKELENFIQVKVYPQFANKKDMGSKTVIKRYNEFLLNVKTTLILNGGHTFIFDILLQNKKLFDGFDNKLRDNSR